MNGERRIYTIAPDVKYVFLRNEKNPNRKYSDRPVSESDYQAISKEWQEIRDFIQKRDGGKCRYCGSAINVQVHHRQYPELWGEENMDDLELVCLKCHAKIHNKTNKKEN